MDYNILASGQLCGTGGCPLQVWVKIGPAPYALAFDRQTLGHEVVRHGSSRRWRGDADAKDGHFAAASIWGKPTR